METYCSQATSSFPYNPLKTISASKEMSFIYCYHPNFKELLMSSQLSYEDSREFFKAISCFTLTCQTENKHTNCFLVTSLCLSFPNKNVCATFPIALVISVGQRVTVCLLPSSLFRASDCVSVHCVLAKAARAIDRTARPKIKQPPCNLAFRKKTKARTIWFCLC